MSLEMNPKIYNDKYCYYITEDEQIPNKVNISVDPNIIYLCTLYSSKILNKLIFVSEITDIINKHSNEYLNIIDIYSVHFYKKRIDRLNYLKYLLPKKITLLGCKISEYLTSHWDNDKIIKMHEIINGRSIQKLELTENIEPLLIYHISNEFPSYFLNYNYPTDLSVIKINDKPSILNNINRVTKKFHYIRKYENNKIIPFINESELIGYKDYSERYINDIYENNFEIQIYHPFNKELFELYNELQTLN